MELLAHASAPSSRKDDERFKRQAKAYSTFQSARTTRVNNSQNDTASSMPAVGEISTVSRPNQEPWVYLDNTQAAWTALDSQLYSASQESHRNTGFNSDGEDDINETTLPLPVDSSMPLCQSRTALSPDESAVLGNGSSRAAEVQPSSSGSRFKQHGQGSYVPTPSRPSRFDDNATPSYLDGLSTFNPAETPMPRVSLLRASKLLVPQDNFSSPSDDIPSQLPSTYSISDINSDPIHSDQQHAPPSSEWGDLPHGSAPQPWNGIIEDESPLKGLKSLGKRRLQRSSPLKQTQSIESPRANMSAHVRPAHSSANVGQHEVSSASLDRAVIPRTRHQTEPVRQAFSSSFELRFSSAPQAQGTPLINDDDAISVRTGQQDLTSYDPRSSFELRFSSAPQAQGTQSVGEFDTAAPVILRRPSSHQLLQTSFDSQFSTSPEARGTQPSHGSDAAVPAALRQHTLEQLLPTSFESRFSSSPQAQGTPLPGNEDPTVDRAQLSSSPSSKINLFQPGTKLFSRENAPSSSAVVRSIPDVSSGFANNKPQTKSCSWQPTSSASEPSSAIIDRVDSEIAADVSPPLNNSRITKRPLLSARIPETEIAAKRRKLASLSTPKAKPNTQERELFKTMSTQINPPPPPTGSNSFKTHITSQLHGQYGENTDLRRRYLPPYTPSRDLRRSERGYWQIDTRSWNAEIQIKFWSFLQSTVGSGASGWGIWCLREDSGNKDTEHEGEEVEPELGMVKVFCWGEVVGHVWLLCFVASNSKLKHVESQWIDADGKVVVRI